ncbi:MAG: D-aminoacylase [Chloroflexota bacterium]
MHDLLIRGATLHDGTGRPGRQADVAVAGDRIAAVGPDAARERATRTIDAGGLVLAPGFIDLHSHADFTLPSYPGALNSLLQGVTSEVVGNCGYTPAPLSADPGKAAAHRELTRGLGPDLDWSWRTFGEYLERLDAARPAVNALPLVGFGAVRTAVVGTDDRAATPAERAAMAAEVDAALTAGAWGFSTGLVYPPGSFARVDEVIEVARPLVAHDALYASHIRSEAGGLLDAIDEAIAVGEALGVRVEVSHLKALGRRNHGKARDAIARIAAARDRGLRVTADAYPYTAGATFLSQVLPPWVHDGGNEELLARIRSAEVRARIRREIETGLPGWSNYVDATGGWGGIRIAACVDPANARFEGGLVDRLAARDGVDPLDLVLDVLLRDRGATLMIAAFMHPDDVDAVVQAPFVGVGSDQLGVLAPATRVHPRCYGTFARLLGPWVRERGVLDLATAVHRATGFAAGILGLTDRGTVAAGQVADLVLFDPARLADRATDEDPTQLAVGVEAVLLGGRFGVDGGRPVDPRLGRVIRRPAARGGPAA